MSKLSELASTDVIFRRWYLGLLPVNNVFWPKANRPSLVGGELWAKKKARPFIESLFKYDHEKIHIIEDFVNSFWDNGDEKELSVKAIGKWTTKLLHQYSLGISLPDSLADEFSAIQNEVKKKMFVPQMMVKWFQQLGSRIQKLRETLFDIYLKTGIFNDIDDKEFYMKAVIDTIMFPASLSLIPALRRLVAVYHSKWLQDQISITPSEENVKDFIHEVLRRFSPVHHNRYWDRKSNQPIILSLPAMNLDSNAWEFPEKFQFGRNHSKNFAWGQPELTESQLAFGCPSKELSIVIMENWLKKCCFGQEWSLKEEKDVLKIRAPTVTLLRKSKKHYF